MLDCRNHACLGFTMGSMIHLTVGGLCLDWGKNAGFFDHSPIYQTPDVRRIPHHYVQYAPGSAEDGAPITELQEGLSKPVHAIVERLNLLGFTRDYARLSFEYLADAIVTRLDNAGEFDFDFFAREFRELDVSIFDYEQGRSTDFGEAFASYLRERLNLGRPAEPDPDSEFFIIEEAVNCLNPYTVLQLLVENPAAGMLPVNWQFHDVEQGGWAPWDAFVKDLDQESRFLIVTEGSSDAAIIRHALKLRKPHVADFFYFVDMQDGYPFSGTGNLYNFAKGLIGIAVQNNTVFLFDNDAEGVMNFNRTLDLKLPRNMTVLKLPDLPAFEQFAAIGPHGKHPADINGKAAAIECYLHLDDAASVRWTSFNKGLGIYHGELIDKARYAGEFYKLSGSEAYDFTKIDVVLDMIIETCTTMKEEAAFGDLEREFGFAPEAAEADAALIPSLRSDDLADIPDGDG
jgi:hypothetical protein